MGEFRVVWFMPALVLFAVVLFSLVAWQERGER